MRLQNKLSQGLAVLMEKNGVEEKSSTDDQIGSAPGSLSPSPRNDNSELKVENMESGSKKGPKLKQTLKINKGINFGNSKESVLSVSK